MTTASSLGECLYLSLFEASGYAVAARRCIRALVDAGVPTTWMPFVPSSDWGLGYAPAPAGSVTDAELQPLLASGREPDSVVAHLVPEYYPQVRERYPDATLVGHTVWETDRLPPHWPGLLEVPDVLVVPCRWNADVIRAAGVRTPVVVVPHAAESPIVATSDTWVSIPTDAFVFYTIAPWTARKAVWKSLQAYLGAFTGSDRVILVVKTSERDFTHPITGSTSRVGPGSSAAATAKLLGASADPAPVLLVTGDASEREIAALHTRGDCFVSLCRSEGWGLGAFDAATRGIPVVTTGFGGHLDYLDAATAFLVDYELVPVDDPAGEHSYTAEQTWAEPSVAHGAELLRQVFSDPAAAGRRAGVLADRIRERYDTASIARQFIDGVAPVCAQRSRGAP